MRFAFMAREHGWLRRALRVDSQVEQEAQCPADLEGDGSVDRSKLCDHALL